MKLRKHKGSKSYKITWFQRTPRVVETHVARSGKTDRVVTGDELKSQPAVYTIGQNPTATLTAFLFGRDKTNIVADIRRFHPEYGPSQVQKNCFLGNIV